MGKIKVMVTGAGGFIGTKVVQELWKRGCEVAYFDVIEPKIKGIKRVNRGTILDQYDLALAARGCNYAIHLAALLGVQKTDSDRLECLYINIQGTLNVIEACVKEGIKKIVFSSSSEVYGDQDKLPISEENPLNPKSVYAVSKIAGEEYLRAYSEMYGIKYNITRLFNVYGEYQREEFVLPKFVQRVVNNEPPIIYGDGEQVRSFCYVEDAARGIVDALLTDQANQVFNIGNDREPISMKDLAYKLIDISGKSIKPEFVSYEESDRESSREIEKRIPCIKKAKQVLGYEPRFPLDEGLKRMIAFYEENNKK
ncbi:MAG: NAD-dependent epimerase/dehydratase family protein [Candidatus Aminicenantes bacterium]|nr:NAD-dependent epimerase/dehydratase family protein [Candidatus Aminicenantes bacterium]NIM84185.1 NAD-dependent epimerase/dehydratase family protein [Candidatus Aminicenantes bacterium]NIN23632.1 NAD-dependent epimerase/dehydratase family protein [Candidatus Aminicenantes bacterium]NIN47339.1 NAD-dependent epimerase/dehydratase family protein [Candidatus Aminicenantes bacterium]NIN90268.1 NAD-dependent epimerase/dehydratase family protein [Candidatus Aminicenantes bacterium]